MEIIDSSSITSSPSSGLRVFLCYSSDDKPIVSNIYHRLNNEPSIMPWFDDVDLLAGQEWDLQIAQAIRSSHVVIVCLSRKSINKEGYVQKEIVRALDVATEKPEGTIFLIPLKLEECKVPRRLNRWQWVDYFKADGYDKLLRSLYVRAQSLNLEPVSKQDNTYIPIANDEQKDDPGLRSLVTLAGIAILGIGLILIVWSAMLLPAILSSPSSENTFGAWLNLVAMIIIGASFIYSGSWLRKKK